MNPISETFMHRQRITYLKWNITKLPKPTLSPVSKSVTKDLIYLSEKFRRKSYSKPVNLINKSRQEFQKKSKLSSNIYTKQIFVLLDGSSVSPGQKLKGFFYSISLNSISRSSHLEEMKEFFIHCKEKFNLSTEVAHLFSHKGKRLKCLHEVSADSKIVIVSDKFDYKGIEHNGINEKRPKTRSPVFQGHGLNIDSQQVTDRINSQFEYSTKRLLKFEESNLPRIKSTKIRSSRIDPNKFERNFKIGKMEKLKNKLAKDIPKIEKVYPAIFDQGLDSLKNKYQFPEGKLHALSAKFKTLVLLSCAINPKHKISSGISRVSFIDYNTNSKEQSYVLARIFDTFDKDSGGTISWEEFMSAMRIIHHGSHNEKIDLFFRVYDKDNSGSVSFAEIQELCKVQLQVESSDNLIDELSHSFASLIFDITETPYKSTIPSSKIKEIIMTNKDQSLIDMFCSFQFLKF